MVDIMRVRVATTGWTGGPGLNTFYFKADNTEGATIITDAENAVQRVRDAFGVGRTMFPPATSIQVSPNVDQLSAATGIISNSYTVATPTVEVGAGLAGYNATAIMLLLRLKTGTVLDGGRVQGRAFLGPVSKGVDADGTPDSGLLVQAQTLGDKLLDKGILGGPDLVVWHRPRKVSTRFPVARPGGIALVTSTQAMDKYAVLRSRRD